MEYIYHYASSLGGITMASDGIYLIGLWFDGQKYFEDVLSDDHSERNLPIFEETTRWLDIYFSGKDPAFTPSLRLKTTAFRSSVWKILLTIPYGETMTYGQIAKIIMDQTGAPRMSSQAIGNAVGHNAISLIIPCHRVIGADGSLTGYAAGIDKKRILLQLEAMNS